MLTLFVGQKLQVFEEIPSTNAYLKEYTAKTTANEGFTVRAKHQTLGRGQFGNVWHDEAGKNLLFSVHLCPHFLSASAFYSLNMSVCLALVQVLNTYKLGFEIKWPNDILYQNKKVCGILIENTISKNQLQQSIIGVGLNVNQTEFGDFPKATSLKTILDEEVSIEPLFEKLLKAIEVEYLKMKINANNVKARYENLLYGMHVKVPVHIGKTKKDLKIVGVNTHGQLLAEVDGTEKTFNFKELEFIL